MHPSKRVVLSRVGCGLWYHWQGRNANKSLLSFPCLSTYFTCAHTCTHNDTCISIQLCICKLGTYIHTYVQYVMYIYTHPADSGLEGEQVTQHVSLTHPCLMLHNTMTGHMVIFPPSWTSYEYTYSILYHLHALMTRHTCKHTYMCTHTHTRAHTHTHTHTHEAHPNSHDFARHLNILL